MTAARIESAPPALSGAGQPAPIPMGKYVPFARLGAGGMAEVFLAVARGPAGFNKLAVVKHLRHPDDESQVQMFLDEARLAALLRHPNIVDTYEIGEARGRYFIAMEYIEGQPLNALMAAQRERGEPLPETLAAFIALLALRGLHAAHDVCDYRGEALGVVHRDVSPHNLLIGYRGEVKLFDFGIAKAAMNSTRTETGVVKGKIRYMAPEQLAEKAVDRRADVYALGIVLWEMLTNRPLFDGDSFAVLTNVALGNTAPVRGVRPDVSPALEAIVARALSREADQRFPTAAAMAEELEGYLRQQRAEGLEEELARRMNELFAEKRELVKSKVRTFIARMAVSTLDSSGALAAEQGEGLPLLEDSSSSGPQSALSVVRGARSARLRVIVLAAAGALVVAGAFGSVLRARAHEPSAEGALRSAGQGAPLAPVAARATEPALAPAPTPAPLVTVTEKPALAATRALPRPSARGRVAASPAASEPTAAPKIRVIEDEAE